MGRAAKPAGSGMTGAHVASTCGLAGRPLICASGVRSSSTCVTGPSAAGRLMASVFKLPLVSGLDGGFPGSGEHVDFFNTTLDEPHAEVAAAGGREDGRGRRAVGGDARIEQPDETGGVGADGRIDHVDVGLRAGDRGHDADDLRVAFERELHSVVRGRAGVGSGSSGSTRRRN